MHTSMSVIHILIPVHYCEVHSNIEHPGRKVNPLRQVCKQLVVEAYYPICVTTHCTFLLNTARGFRLTVTSTYQAEVFGITIHISVLQASKQCLTCLGVGELHSTGNVSRNVTWWTWMTVRVDSQIMVGYVEDQLAKSIRTSTTVFHRPIQMNFNASSFICKLSKPSHVSILYSALGDLGELFGNILGSMPRVKGVEELQILLHITANSKLHVMCNLNDSSNDLGHNYFCAF